MNDDLVKQLREYGACGMVFEAADRIEKLEAALIRIWAWHPISVSQPRKTLDEIRDFAFATIKGENNDDA